MSTATLFTRPNGLCSVSYASASAYAVYCIHSWLSLITVACAVWLVEKGTVQ